MDCSILTESGSQGLPLHWAVRHASTATTEQVLRECLGTLDKRALHLVQPHYFNQPPHLGLSTQYYLLSKISLFG